MRKQLYGDDSPKIVLENHYRNSVTVSTDFEKPSPPPRKAASVLKSKSLTCFKFRFLRLPLVERLPVKAVDAGIAVVAQQLSIEVDAVLGVGTG